MNIFITPKTGNDWQVRIIHNDPRIGGSYAEINAAEGETQLDCLQRTLDYIKEVAPTEIAEIGNE